MWYINNIAVEHFLAVGLKIKLRLGINIFPEVLYI